MKIETTLDKVVISEDEMQLIVKRYITDQTGRTVSGTVNFQQRNGSTDGSHTAAWCHLTQPESKQ